MGERRYLVVATVPADWRTLRAQAPDLAAAADDDVKVVAPASDLTFGQWLTNAEDDAREEAEATAAQTAAELPQDADAAAGDVDPLQAAEDALRTFPADEIVLVVAPAEEKSWLERSATKSGFGRFPVPVRVVVAAP